MVKEGFELQYLLQKAYSTVEATSTLHEVVYSKVNVHIVISKHILQ